MTDDAERREVARRLREVQGYVIPGTKTEVHPIAGRIIGVACGYELPDFQGLLGRLADLIEPDDPPYNLYTLYEAVFHRSPRCWECIEDGEVDELVDALLDICNMPGHERIQRFQPDEPKVRCVAEVKICGERLEQLVRDAVAEVTGIDRDALLELANEINDTSCDNHGELSVSLGDIWGWAQAIREALGVTDG